MSDGSAPAGTTTASVDVLIVTALKLEFDAVVECGLKFPGPTKAWQERQEGPYHYRAREFFANDTSNQPPLRIAVARATEMGEVSAAVCAVRLLDALQAPTLAMCGVCAGREGAVELGDVIATERLYKYDSGAATSTARDEANYRLDLLSDVRTYNLHLDWRQKLDEFDGVSWQDKIPAQRPIPVAEQARWIAARLADGCPSVRDVYALAERAKHCDNWEAAIHRLHRLGWLSDDWTTLSSEGLKHGRRELSLYPQGRVLSRRPALRVGAIATGARVQRDVRLFERLDAVSRRTIGVEMEGAALAAVAEIYDRKMILAKGVMDFADPDKDDTFKGYAARAAASFLLTFLMTHAPRAQSRATARIPAGLATAPAPSATTRGLAKASATSARAEWYLQLRDYVSRDEVRECLKAYGDETITVEAEDWDVAHPAAHLSATHRVSSDRTLLDRLLKAFRRSTFRDVAGVSVEYIVEHDVVDPADPIRGKFGWLPRRDGRVLSATISPNGAGWYECTVTVSSLTQKHGLPDAVVFHVHPTLCDRPIRVPTRDEEARYSFVAWGSFSVGVELGDGQRLELDLANLPGVPAQFIDQ